MVLSENMSKTVENQQTKELSDDDDDETNDETDEEGDIHDNPEDIITLNIGGVRHETRIQTLRKLTRKTTRLSEVADIAEKTGKREFYFDRQPDFFPYILNFYRQGKLHLPLNLCGMILRDELKYWMIDDKDIEQCCWVHYINTRKLTKCWTCSIETKSTTVWPPNESRRTRLDSNEFDRNFGDSCRTLTPHEGLR